MIETVLGSGFWVQRFLGKKFWVPTRVNLTMDFHTYVGLRKKATLNVEPLNPKPLGIMNPYPAARALEL